MAKVRQELSKKNTSEKVDYSSKVVTCMTDNPDYPSPNPPLADVSAAAASVRAAADDVESTRKLLQTKMSYLAQQETSLDSLLTQLGTYVENASGGDEVKINGAGMDVKRDRTSATLPAKVTGLMALVGDNAGEIEVKWDKEDMAKTYTVETALDAATLVWQNKLITSKTKGTLKDLTSANRFHIRVAAVGSAGQGPWSDTISKVVP